MSTQPSFITPTAEALERAGLRLELAESVIRAWQPTGDEDADEHTFDAADQERDQARIAYRAMFELRTGLSAETAERRLGL